MVCDSEGLALTGTGRGSGDWSPARFTSHIISTEPPLLPALPTHRDTHGDTHAWPHTPPACESFPSRRAHLPAEGDSISLVHRTD